MTINSMDAVIEETPKVAQESEQTIDSFCVEKNLRSWASSRIIARGRDYYRRRCVLSLESDDEGHISASVEGTLESPYQVEIYFDPCRFPVSKCTCPFTFEPLCKHAVAVLIAWQQQETGSEPTLGSLPTEEEVLREDPKRREEHMNDLKRIELEDRRARCLEQGIRITRKPADGFLGVYGVRSSNPDRQQEEAYRVLIRDAAMEHASCDCTDYRTNELGTCKHLEVVKRFLSSKQRAAQLSREEARSRRVSAYFRPRETHQQLVHALEEIRFYVSPVLREKADAVLRGEVDAQGYLRNGRDPSRQRQRFERLLKSLQTATGIAAEVDPPVNALFSEAEAAFRWESRLEELAKDPAKHPAWQRSVGAMGISLHPYQTQGILFASKKRKAFIGDDMGLGKTMQAIGTALLLKELGAIKRAVIICPASLKFQWRQEIQKVSKASVAIIAGSSRERALAYKKAEEFFLILNYELFYRDLAHVLALTPDLVILDEAQRIKNWETKIHQTLKRLQSPYRLVLTGTPLENRLAELHSITEFLNPRALGAAWKLLPTYATLNEEDRISGYTNLGHLRDRLKSFLIRRTRAEVLTQLPKRTENNFWTPLLPEQKDVHDEYAAKVTRLINKWKRFKRLTKEDLQRLFMYLTCMRIVCNAHGQYVWKEIETEVITARRMTPGLKKKIASPKLDEFYRVMADLLEDPTQKVVVFSQWERMIRLAELTVRDILESTGSRSVLFSGSLSMKKREAEIKRFQEDAKTRVFFSTDAGGVGLNLQHAANVVVNLEMPWNPAILEQRIGRVYRMGQKKSVQAINLMSAECAEQRIHQLVGQKKALFAGVFDEKTQDIRFDLKETASFLDKLQHIVPGDGAVGHESDEPGEEDLASAAEAGTDSVLAAKADLVTQTSEGAPPQNPSPSAGDTVLSSLLAAVKMSQNESGGIHLSIPKPAVEVLKEFRPLLEMLLKLSA
jgi:hypothetical protein